MIKPAITEAAAKGIDVGGPFSSDTVFLKLKDGVCDAVVTMYHDQGQIAMTLMGFQRGVTVAGGLPIAITTPAHGTAFDIAGQGRADVGAMAEAFKLAISPGWLSVKKQIPGKLSAKVENLPGRQPLFPVMPFRETDFPTGVFLMTGTGIVPPESFSLSVGDKVAITIGDLNLGNVVAGGR